MARPASNAKKSKFSLEMEMKRAAAVAMVIITLFAGASLAQVFGAGVKGAEKAKVSQILASPEKYVGKKVDVTGPVVNVCKSRGCWAELAGDKDYQSLRVKVDDGVIVFPPALLGKTLTVEGEIERVFIRCSEDATGKKPCGEEKSVYYQIRATGAVSE